MRRIKFELGLISTLMTIKNSSYELYLDIKTSHVLFIPFRIISAALGQNGKCPSLTDSEVASIPTVREVLCDSENRYLNLPEVPPLEEIEWMNEFSELITDPDLFQRVLSVLDFQTIIENFDEAIASDELHCSQWLEYKTKRLDHYAAKWLKSVSIPHRNFNPLPETDSEWKVSRRA